MALQVRRRGIISAIKPCCTSIPVTFVCSHRIPGRDRGVAFPELGLECWWQDAVVIGGLDMQQQARALAKRPHIVVATPGRLRVIPSILRKLSHPLSSDLQSFDGYPVVHSCR
jgi:hypothetical protein